MAYHFRYRPWLFGWRLRWKYPVMRGRGRRYKYFVKRKPVKRYKKFSSSPFPFWRYYLNDNNAFRRHLCRKHY